MIERKKHMIRFSLYMILEGRLRNGVNMKTILKKDTLPVE